MATSTHRAIERLNAEAHKALQRLDALDAASPSDSSEPATSRRSNSMAHHAARRAGVEQRHAEIEAYLAERARIPDASTAMFLPTESRYAAGDARAWLDSELRLRREAGNARPALVLPAGARLAATAAMRPLVKESEAERRIRATSEARRARSAAARGRQAEAREHALEAQDKAFSSTVAHTIRQRGDHWLPKPLVAAALSAREARIEGWAQRRGEEEARWQAAYAFDRAVRSFGGGGGGAAAGIDEASLPAASAIRPIAKGAASPSRTPASPTSPVWYPAESSRAAARSAGASPPLVTPATAAASPARASRGDGTQGERSCASSVSAARFGVDGPLSPAGRSSSAASTAARVPERRCALCERLLPIHLLPHAVTHTAIRRQRRAWRVPCSAAADAQFADHAHRSVCVVCFDIVRSGFEPKDVDNVVERSTGDGWLRSLYRATARK